MAFKNSTATTAAILEFLPKADLSACLIRLVQTLDAEDESAANVIIDLVEESHDAQAYEALLSVAREKIRAGSLDTVLTVSRRSPRLATALFDEAVESVVKAKSNRISILSGNAVLSDLQFCMKLIPELPFSRSHQQLFHACLEILPSSSLECHVVARDIVFQLLAGKDDDSLAIVYEDGQDNVWLCIRALLSSSDKYSVTSGYSLWLRWMLGVSETSTSPALQDELLALLMDGLRTGDVERRKTCLNILKISTQADSSAVPARMREVYTRYATVFETIVLGRYINQVLECKDDLDFFATSASLAPAWLYTLLGAALEPRMQDSNRRFIGNWVMQAKLHGGDDLKNFFAKDFLPWATQGQHFVSTVMRRSGQVVCLHGERLAEYVAHLRAISPTPELIQSIVLDLITQKQSTMFAYCTTYLLEGLGASTAQHKTLNLDQLRRLPEVARDYVGLKLTGDVRSGAEQSRDSVRYCREQDILTKLMSARPEDIEDIWSDMEYLEFPKRLSMLIPGLLLAERNLVLAKQDTEFASSITTKLQTLLQVASTKAYVFPPLSTQLELAMLSCSELCDILDLSALIMWVAMQPPRPTIDLLLEEAILPLMSANYEQYFGERVEVGFAAYIDLVSRLKRNQQAIGIIIHTVLQPWKAQKVPPPTVSPWKNALQLQVLLLCLEQYESSSSEEIETLVEDLFHILANEPLPSYRHLLELICIRMLAKHELKDDLLRRLKTNDHHPNPKYLASLMKMAARLACSSLGTQEFAEQLATSFVPLAASSKVVIRHEAQWQVPALMEHARRQCWSSITGNPALASLDEYIRSLERFQEPPQERQLGQRDPLTQLSLTYLVEGSWLELDSTEKPLCRHEDFVKLQERSIPPGAPNTCLPLGDPVLRSSQTQDASKSRRTSIDQPTQPGPRTSTDVATALQTKGTAYLARSLSTTPTSRPFPDLVVVASLVTNPYNLGGLSRVSEIFGAGAIAMQNQNVVSNKDFLSVAVSSHLHFPILQLSAPGMVPWLIERKQEGFTVVGIEQTDRSVMLGTEKAQLPRKCCLVVGSEREGIPANVLIECGMLVEIEQRGVTRSLNVQTAVGMVLFEYGRQHGG